MMPGADPTDNAAESRAYGRVTQRLIPFLFCCYGAAYLDRVNIGFAKLQMLSALRFSETVYGLGAGIFFIGYFLFEIPSNIILHKVGARRWIIGWIIDRTHSADLGVYALAAILSVGSLLVLTIPGRIVNR